MISKKEIVAIVISTIIIAFSITLIQTTAFFLTVLAFVFVIILINIVAKKVMAYYLETDVETKLWEFSRYGYQPHHKFKKPFPAGAFMPLLSKVIFAPFFGQFVWMATMEFDVKGKVYRAAKRHGFYSYSEVNDKTIAFIAAAGIIANLVFAGIGYLIGFELFAKYSIWFALFNIIPLSKLDGNKIFFGSKELWSLVATLTLIAFGLTLLIV